jgi:hypothetical protein
MRTRILLLIATAGLGASAAVAAADSVQTAVWEPRTLRHFTLPLVVNSENGPLQMASCDQIYDEAKLLLLQLGARASDIRADLRGCYAYTIERSIDLTFSVLVPTAQTTPTTTNARGPLVEAHWKTVLLKGNCRLLEDATKKIVPLFSTSDVKLISSADCAKLGVGFFGKVLTAPEEQSSP